MLSCNKDATPSVIYKAKSTIKYAKGFDIIIENGFKKLIIKSPYLNAKKSKEFILIDKKDSYNNLLDNKNVIKIPLNRIVATSTTHIPMIELLNEENTIIGFPHIKYISSKKTRALITKNKIVDIGKENTLNTEIVLDINPELVVGYSIESADNSLKTINNAGISVIYNGDWLEETPLGRAEWIKFFGVLYNKELLADSIFNNIEKNYLMAKKIAGVNATKKKILSGAIMNKNSWTLPAGDSYVAKFLEDANTNYLFKNTTGKGSLALSFESVFEKGKNADFWISPGHFTSKKQLLNNNPLYAKLKAFQKNEIYTATTKKGKSGGILYYEIAPTRPDLVLKDFIKITQPKALPNYSLTFFEKMK